MAPDDLDARDPYCEPPDWWFEEANTDIEMEFRTCSEEQAEADRVDPRYDLDAAEEMQAQAEEMDAE